MTGLDRNVREPGRLAGGAGPTAPERSGSALSDAMFAELAAGCPRVVAARRIAVGVSGGADSMALCLLADAWTRGRGVALTALTVDHGLRPAAKAEAERVAGWMAARGIRHRILSAPGGRPAAAVQRIARDRRLAEVDRWCRDNDHDAVLFAHTLEDQAETLWLRLLAHSGLDGLAGMAAETRVAGLTIARPLLAIPKIRLIATCRARRQGWIEDPGNRDARYTRVRLRRLAARLAAGGFGVEQAVRFADCMAATRRAMDRHSRRFMAECGGVSPAGYAWFDHDAFRALPEALAHGLLARLLRGVGGRPYPPRQARLRRLAAELRGGRFAPRTLGGCLAVRSRAGHVLLCREPGPVAGPVTLRPDRRTRWDNRFEAVWRGRSPVWLGALGDDGWRTLRTGPAPADALVGLARLPHFARSAHPAIRTLDGSIHIPHFNDDAACHGGGLGALLDVSFQPDIDWIGDLAAMAAK